MNNPEHVPCAKCGHAHDPDDSPEIIAAYHDGYSAGRLSVLREHARLEQQATTKRIRDLIGQAMSVPADQREQKLIDMLEAEPNDPEITALLEHHREGGSFRTLLYDRLRRVGLSYVELLDAGGMEFSNETLGNT